MVAAALHVHLLLGFFTLLGNQALKLLQETYFGCFKTCISVIQKCLEVCMALSNNMCPYRMPLNRKSYAFTRLLKLTW